MTDTAIVERIKDLIANDLEAHIAREDIDLATPLFEDGLGLDSIVLVELISLVEQAFDIRFSDEELLPDSFRDLSAMAEMVAAKVSD